MRCVLIVVLLLLAGCASVPRQTQNACAIFEQRDGLFDNWRRAAYRAEYVWRGPVGTATTLASALKRWPRLRFEVTETATATSEGERYAYTPSLGIHHATMGLHGDILVPEDRIRHALVTSGGDDRALRAALDDLLGAAWDAELDVFRQAAEGEPVRWLTEVG